MSFHVQMVSTTYDLFKSQQRTDVTFFCKDGQIGAHSVVLQAHSEWFKNNSDRSVIGLLEYTKESALEFLTFLYTGIGNFEKNSPVKELLTAFRCTYHLNKEISNEDNNQSPNETKIEIEDNELKVEIEDTKLKVEIEDSPVASGSGPSLNLLPNPFAQNISDRRKKNSSKSTKKRLPTSNDGDEDNSIVECPPPVIVINDTPDDFGLPQVTEVKGGVDVTTVNLKTEPSSSNQSDMKTSHPESLAKKKKSNTRIEPRLKHGEIKEQQRIFVEFNSTEEEDERKRQKEAQTSVLFEVERSLSNNAALRATVLSFKGKKETFREMEKFCFVCLDYVPVMSKENKSHYRDHQWNRWSKRQQCPSCLKYFGFKALYQMHTTLCNRAK